MKNLHSKKQFIIEENKKIILVPLQIIAGLVVIAGTMALMFEVNYFAKFSFGIYLGRLLATLIGFSILALTYFKFGKEHPILLVHVLLLTIITSFASIIYQLPQTLYINSHLLALVIFTSALFLNWDLKNQIIVAIYYNIIFALSVLLGSKTVYFLPSMFASVMFVSLISLMSIVASAINYKLRIDAIQKNFEAKIILDNSTEAIFKSKSNGQIINYNNAFIKLFNAEVNKVFFLREIFSYPEDYEKFQAEIFQELKLIGFNFNSSSAGINRTLNLNAKLIHDLDTNEAQIIGSIQDITERIIAEEKIKKYNSELKNLNDSKDKFFSILAHDLLSPFGVLMGYSEILSTQTNNLSKDELKEFSEYIYNTSKKSLNLLNELLEWSRLQTNRISFNPTPIKLYSIVNDIIYLYENMSKSKKITISNYVSESIEVFADSHMISTLIRNLFSNAIKFTPENGTVSIDAKRVNGEIEITVTDSGVGMDEQTLENLFRLDKTITTKGTNKEKGNGLGLIICKELVEKNNGTISVVSKEGEGSKFKVLLPAP